MAPAARAPSPALNKAKAAGPPAGKAAAKPPASHPTASRQSDRAVAAAREAEVESLKAENSRISEALAGAQKETAAAVEAANDEKHAAELTTERAQQLEAMLASAGYNSMKLGAIDWSTEAAKQLLAEEEAAQAAFDQVLGQVREGAAQVREMLVEQKELKQRLAPLAAAVAAA